MPYLALLLLLLTTACRAPVVAQASTEPVPFILDADTANEIDDLYAIAYLFAEEGVDWRGLTSAQWFHHMSGDSTVYQSQRLNEELLAVAGRMDLPHPRGADTIMGHPWGGYDPRDSPAARFIIEQARSAGAGKLVVMCIGASTNLASAIALAPDIKDKIRAYVLGFQYDTEGGFWNKDEFNIRRDLNAANYLLNAEGLELHIMSTSTARQYQWQRDPTFERLDRSGPIGAYLKARWETFAPGATSWIMWDVALLQAFLKPEQATEIQVTTPPENTRRQVWLYTDIDEEAMARDFWQRLLSYP
ncbi:inosine-uridine nucleoside N-ribohydrolase [Lewinella marina]|uniref:Nucleoside hydrolase n=1 Tax=Neolewinella marina TaxID=438751 RepID=A0A2G0CAQ5_9BACT|nr:nucleoside hydrolase [Neolewinella marina]NJB87177.1 inosine-uridine nucleoside N-ribohydrolase [Neolewinella marina]PHK97059.1 nucleoside hydrolase [Neolewinella marina]